MAEDEYFEKTPKKAGRWFRAFIIFSLLYGITISLWSFFNWILFIAATYSLFMSYFTLPVQPKIFQSRPKSRPQSQPTTNPNAQRTKAIVIGISAFIFILIMIPFVQGIIEGVSDTQPQEEEPILEEASLDAPDMITTANGFFNDKQYDSALKYYEKALEVDPTYMEAIYGKGIVAYNRGNVDVANRYFVQAYEGGFRYVWLSWALADMYDKQGQSTRAIGLYKESVGLDSTYTDSYKRLAELEPANAVKWVNLAQKYPNN